MGGGGQGKEDGVGGCLHNGRGYLFVMDKRVPGERGQIPDQSGWCGGAGGPREECTCDEEGRLDWSVGCKRRAADAAAFRRASSDILFVFQSL